MSIVTELVALGYRCLARAEEEFAEAAAAGDLDRAGTAVGEASRLSEALKRQESACGETEN